MRTGSESTPLTLKDLGFSPAAIGEAQNGAYLPVQPGEQFPSLVTHTIGNQTLVLSGVARAARARFESTGAPVRVLETHTQAPEKPSGSA